MVRASIRDFAPSASASRASGRKMSCLAIARPLLTLICAVMFFCALAAPLFVPLLIR
jgi:hypothetical protein